MSGSNFLATPIASMERSAGSLTTKARRVETNLLDDGIDKCVRISRRDPGGCTRFFDRTRACLVECLGKHLTCRSFPDVADTVLNYGKEICWRGHRRADIGGKPILKYNGRSPRGRRILIRGASKQGPPSRTISDAKSLRCSDC